MIKVGITGGIGSGKTYISRMFEQLNVPVYFTDDRAKFLMQSDCMVIDQIKSVFGNEVYKNSKLDRFFLAQIVFQNKKMLQKLNEIVHPAVQKDVLAWYQLHEDKVYTIKESALLFETGSYKWLDKTILIHAEKNQRILRVMQRDNINREKVLARMKNQMPDTDKMELADFIVNNDGNSEVIKIIKKIDTFFNLSIAV